MRPSVSRIRSASRMGGRLTPNSSSSSSCLGSMAPSASSPDRMRVRRAPATISARRGCRSWWRAGEVEAVISSKITTMKPSVFVISITPFDAEGRLDEPGLRAHLDRMADAGVGVYLGGGGSGEGFTLDRRRGPAGARDRRRPDRRPGAGAGDGHRAPHGAADDRLHRRGRRRRGRRRPDLLARPGPRAPAHPGRDRGLPAGRAREHLAPLRRVVAPVGRLRRAPRPPGHPRRRAPPPGRRELQPRRHRPARRPERRGRRPPRAARRRADAGAELPGPRRAGLPDLRGQPGAPAVRLGDRELRRRRPRRHVLGLRRGRAALGPALRPRRHPGHQGRARPARPAGRHRPSAPAHRRPRPSSTQSSPTSTPPASPPSNAGSPTDPVPRVARSSTLRRAETSHVGRRTDRWLDRRASGPEAEPRRGRAAGVSGRGGSGRR